MDIGLLTQSSGMGFYKYHRMAAMRFPALNREISVRTDRTALLNREHRGFK